MIAQKTVMAIGAHIGDMELTTGGVLSSMVIQGHKIVTVALTAGEKGNPPEIPVGQYRNQKIAEAQAFAQILGGVSEVLPYSDGELPDNDEVKYLLCDIIRKYKPDVLLTHWKNSMHKDHEAAYRIVKDAQFYAGLPGFVRELPAHYAKGPYYAENWEDSPEFQPYVYTEVTQEGFVLWEKAIQTQWFALNSKSFRYRDYYASLMVVRGCEARKQYAQAFNVDSENKRVILQSF